MNTVITYLNGYLSLWDRNKENELHMIDQRATPATQAKYKHLKSIVHVSVSLIMIMDNIIQTNQKSTHHIRDIERVASQISVLRSASTPKSIELDYLEHIESLLNKLLVTNNVDSLRCLQARYLYNTQNMQAEMARQATQLQLDGMHQIVSEWIEKYAIQCSKTRILIACAKGPKEKLIEKEYMEWLYTEHGFLDIKEEKYITCVEMLPEQLSLVSSSQLIEFFQKRQLNEQIAERMLEDRQAMEKDVLGEYASKVLQSLCPLPKQRTMTISSSKYGLFSKSELPVAEEEKQCPRAKGALK